MTNFSLRMDGEVWSIIDEATQAIAKMDGIHLTNMPQDEAHHMLKLLKAIEQLRRQSIRASTSAKRFARAPAGQSEKRMPRLNDFLS
jgi:hypothetical protein